MKTIWPAATLAIAISGYFAWSNYSAAPVQSRNLDDCHRLAGEVEAIHRAGGAIPAELSGAARGCSVSFGQNWAANASPPAESRRAEGALRAP